MKKILLFLLQLFFINAYSQDKKEINLQFKKNNESEFIQSFLSNNNLYILNFEKESTTKDNIYYSLYKIDLNSKNIKKIQINDGNIFKNVIIKENKDSLLIINIATFDSNATSYRISKSLDQQEKTILPVAKHINKYTLENFFDFKQNLRYQNLQTTKLNGTFSLKNNSLYCFDNSFSQKSISFSRNSLGVNFEKNYLYKNLKGYENDFREYSKFRNLNTFYLSDNKIFILPNLENLPINIEESNMLVFDNRNGDLKNIQKINTVPIINTCEKIKTFDDRQFQISSQNGKKLIEFGIDKSENFCICHSKEISENFYTIKTIRYKQHKIYIGKNTQTKTTQIIY